MEPTPTRRRLGALPLAVAIGLALTGVGQTVAVVRHEPEPPRLLRLDLAEGMQVVYRTEMEMDARISAGLFGQPFELAMTLDQDWRVEEVGVDGSATIEIDTTLIDSSTSFGDIPEEELLGGEGTSTMRLAPDGRILEASLGLGGSLGSPANIPGLEGLGPTFPEDPVAPGDRWDLSAEVPLLPGGPSLHVEGEGRLDGYEEVQGVRAAVILSEVEMPFEFELDLAELEGALGGEELPEEAQGTVVYDGEMTVESRQWVDPATGLQVRAELEGDGEIGFSVGGFPQNGEAVPAPRTNLEFELTMTLERR